MSLYKYFVKENARRAEIDEFLARELRRAGYSRVEISKTPLGTRVVVYAARPGIVIGRRGQSIRDLTKILEEKFGLENPQISVAPIETPSLDPKVVAGEIAQALERGIHFRRAAYWGIQRVMDSGALGVEVKVSGKLTTERARFEKYRQGYLPKCGDAVLKQLRRAVVDTQLKPGLYGVKVAIMPPRSDFPDRPRIKGPTAEVTSKPKEEVEETKEAEGEEVEEAKKEPAKEEKERVKKEEATVASDS